MSQGVFLGLGARQSMSLSPRLQQAIRLLQMSSMEFEQELRDALDTNPFLESAADEVPPAESDTDPALPASAIHEEATVEDGRAVASAREDDDDPMSWAAARLDLRDHLRQQLNAWPATSRERATAELVIDSLDDDGYLRDDLRHTLQALNLEQAFTPGEIERAHAIVRGFEPAGVGATDLIDCLRLQLRACEHRSRELALMLLGDGLDLLLRRDFAALRNRLDRSEVDIRSAHQLIQRLDPRPGLRFAASAADHVTPDVFVTVCDGEPRVAINDASMRSARLNDHYVRLFRSCRRGQHPAMAQQLQEARWLLRNAAQRFVTIQRVAEAIVRRQREFFVHGDLAMRPMVLKEIAEEVGLHESTVSRATGNKYMATSRGLYEFKHFFSRQLATQGGGACSAAAVRALMQEIIGGEDAKSPLSDVIIADLLRGQGINVARRTVAKYRSMMRVLPAELRRQA